MSHAPSIIQKFGGIRPMARALGLPASTVQDWKESGLIPARHQQAVLNKARELGVALAPDDFFDVSAGKEGAAA
jgi:hypothetical protein